eukprot:871827-Rhodomonas_salina.1
MMPQPGRPGFCFVVLYWPVQTQAPEGPDQFSLLLLISRDSEGNKKFRKGMRFPPAPSVLIGIRCGVDCCIG